MLLKIDVQHDNIMSSAQHG